MGMFMDSCPLCWDSKDYCKCDPQNVLNHIHQNTNPKEVVRTTSTLDGMRKRLGPNPCDGSSNIEMTRVIGEDTSLPDIIITGTDGDDYSVLNKVDLRIKDLALNGIVETHQSVKIDMPLVPEGTAILAPVPSNHPKVKAIISGDRPNSCIIQEANIDTLEEAAGPGVESLSPENKHWLMKQMGFKGLGHGKWKHILFEEEIEFNLQTDSLVQLAFQIHKTGYKNAHSEWASQQKTASV